MKAPYAMEFWNQIINHFLASYEFHQINRETSPCAIVHCPAYHHEYVLSFTVKIKIKCCIPASWPSIAFSDTDIMLRFYLPYLGPNLGYVSLPSYILLTAIIYNEIKLKDKIC